MVLQIVMWMEKRVTVECHQTLRSRLDLLEVGNIEHKQGGPFQTGFDGRRAGLADDLDGVIDLFIVNPDHQGC